MLSKNKKLLILASVSFVSMSVFFQNCSLSKFNAGLGLGSSSSDNQSASVQPGFIAPVSSQGVAGMTKVNALGEEVIVLKEYRYKTIERYFLTTRALDQQIVEAGALKNDFISTGNIFSVYKNKIAGSSPLCRFYNSIEKTHLYTADEVECDQMKSLNGMSYEGIEGYVVKINRGASCPANTQAVYKAYDSTSALQVKRHRLTGDQNLINNLVSTYNWVSDEIGFCVSSLTLVDSQLAPPVDPPSGPAVGTISCTNGSSYSNINQLATQICATQHTCVRLNGTLLGQSTGQSACDDQFGPCAECTSSTVNVAPSPQRCTLNGNTVANGASVTAYQSANVASGSTCVSQQRVCTNGNLSGSYTFANCTVNGVIHNPQPPTNPGTNLCPPGVPVPSRVITAGDGYSTWYSTRHPGNTPYVVAIDVPVDASSLTDTLAVINFSPKSGPGAREYSISRSPCDFTTPVSSYGYNKVHLSYDPNILPSPHGFYLSPGRWYLNLRSTACEANVTCSMNMQAQP